MELPQCGSESMLNLRYLADEMGLKRVSPGKRLKGNENKLFSIFDGQQYVFQESKWLVVTLLQLFWRYGFTFFRSVLRFITHTAAQDVARFPQIAAVNSLAAADACGKFAHSVLHKAVGHAGVGFIAACSACVPATKEPLHLLMF